MEEHKNAFAHYVTDYCFLDVGSNHVGDIKAEHLDYKDLRHCVECEGYQECWSQMGTVVNGIKHSYEDYSNMALYCGCGRKMNYHECVFG